MKAKVVTLRMDGPGFLRRVRELAKVSGNIFIVLHARKRMVERGYTDEDVQQCLLRGVIDEGPFLNKHHHWQSTLRRMYAGQEIRVAAVLDNGLVVITVI